MMYWFFAFVISAVYGSNRICPDKSSCSDFSTCCSLSDETYGCCPLENAVCCDDHIHCCPENTKCAVGMCVQLDKMNVTSLKIHAQDTVKCYDSEFVCADDFTCCLGKLPGTYDCCPFENAVCCEDGQHCCPENTVCDFKRRMCRGEEYISEMYDSLKNKLNIHKFAKLLHLRKSNLTSVICPGSSFQCPDGSTCCQLPDSHWGCCPFNKATCCEDHLHCCPENMKCDITSQACTQGFTSIPSMPNKVAEPLNATKNVCPDKSTCFESETCCTLRSTHYGCCPYPNAICCSDYKHCCPDGYTCDILGKQCKPTEKKWLLSISKYFKN